MIIVEGKEGKKKQIDQRKSGGIPLLPSTRRESEGGTDGTHERTGSEIGKSDLFCGGSSSYLSRCPLRKRQHLVFRRMRRWRRVRRRRVRRQPRHGLSPLCRRRRRWPSPPSPPRLATGPWWPSEEEEASTLKSASASAHGSQSASPRCGTANEMYETQVRLMFFFFLVCVKRTNRCRPLSPKDFSPLSLFVLITFPVRVAIRRARRKRLWPEGVEEAEEEVSSLVLLLSVPLSPLDVCCHARKERRPK